MTVRVVIVEDEAIVALDLRRQVEDLGYAVCGVYADAQAAVAACDASRPELALMDIRLLGETDGLVAAEDLYVCSGVPVVLVSAYPDPETLARARRAGAYAFVPKPFSPAALTAAIELTLGKHAEVRRASERARLLRCAVEHSPAAIVVTDAQRKVALVTPAAARLLEVRAAELLDRDLGGVLVGLDGWASPGAVAALAPGAELRGEARHGPVRVGVSVARDAADELWAWTIAPAAGARSPAGPRDGS